MKAWIEGLDYVRDWKTLRCISPVAWDGGSQKELIVFADASEKAYGCCVYLRTTVNGQVFVNLVTSKTRVAPLKKTTLPRLELLAALLAARLLKFVTSALQLETTGNSYTCWSDSQVALSWIKSNAAKWKQFVQNRVLEIQELTSPERWHFCPGKENPADLLTRGISAREITNSNMWLHGPAWLNESQPRSDEEIPDWTREEEDEDARETVLVLTPVEGTKNLLEYDRFSDFGKLVRVVTWVLRFTTNCRPHQERRSSSELSPGELENGGITLLRCIQGERYGEEIEQLISGREVKGGSPISRLSPFIGKDGLLRMQGRLAFASSLLYDEKHPIILPKCHLTLLLVKNKHYMMKHAGVDTLVTAIRNNFWIVSVRTLAKKICRSCIHCQRQDARACKQAMAPLPEDRVKKSPPFSVIGIDHAGPLFCSDTSNRKLYILLFTCAVVRAVHLELVDSLSLEDFILAFKRFVARRGHPSIIYSDNAQTFKAAHKQVEACINSRPLIYVGDDCNPLTPSHFLIGRGSALSPSMVEEYVEKVSDLELREKCETEAVSQLWGDLAGCVYQKLANLDTGGQKCDIGVGSMVLVREDGKPRLQWPLGVITKTFVGRDGLIRAVELKTKKGHFTRALQKLHKLELVSEVKGGGQSESDPKTTVEDRAKACTSDDKKLQNSPVYTRAGRQRRAPKKLDL
ncbi:hypothetical protein RRG08_035464 [Elysia crispata]|uniref:Integrase catalytic domain-containing protein n=1 Tax=Elysia crispata TaxID=231223 RepID=A0AAE0YTB5_9GAST|nr:hypothetical protein RRG08_035464 [Elysia crispata]